MLCAIMSGHTTDTFHGSRAAWVELENSFLVSGLHHLTVLRELLLAAEGGSSWFLPVASYTALFSEEGFQST